MFEDSTFESTGRIRTRSRRWMIAAFALNGSILLALILFPLAFPDAIPRLAVSHLIAVPPLVSEVPKQQVARQRSTDTTPAVNVMISQRPSAPLLAHLDNPEAGPPSDGPIAMGDGVGIPDGTDSVFHSASGPRVVQQVAPKGPTTVSSGVMSGRLIHKVVPTYPAMGRAVHIEGTVVLQAIISKTGTIENLRVVGGPAMLQQAAMDAVKQWRYQPYELDGQPVEVETTINVVFTMGR